MTIKNFVKTSVVAFFAAMTLVACSDDDKEKAAPAEDAKMLTFGFYQEDNADVLSKDYVAVIPAAVAGQSAINIALPSVVNKSALVARFTINDGNTITVGGVAQVSQTTANDFTVPVDYTVSNSDKTQNVLYTVTITKADNMAWSEVAQLDAAAVTGDATVTGVYSGTVLKVNLKDNQPYVAFGIRPDDNKLSVAKFDGTAWSRIGAASFTHKVSGSHYNFDITPDGTPYVAFNDQDNNVTNKGGISVMKFDGTAWNLVGNAGITATTAQYVGIVAINNGIIVAQQNNKNGGDFSRRAIVASYWNGSTWASEAAPFAGTYARQSMVSNGEYAYILAAGASSPAAYSIYKTNGIEKNVVIEGYLPDGASGGSGTADISLAIAPDGTLYLLAPDDAEGSAKMRLSVFKNNSFSTVGGSVIPVSEGAYDRHSIVKVAIAPDGTPFVVYNDNTTENNIRYVSLDNETKQWTAPVTIATNASSASADVNVVFTPTGVGYVSFVDKDNKLHLLKYSEK